MQDVVLHLLLGHVQREGQFFIEQFLRPFHELLVGLAQLFALCGGLLGLEGLVAPENRVDLL